MFSTLFFFYFVYFDRVYFVLMSIPRIALRSGASIPSLGYGVGTAWFGRGKGGDALATCLHSALGAGVLHIDEAEMYKNEDATGEAFQGWIAKGNRREAVFLTSKLLDGVSGGIEARCRQTLAALGVDYLDLYLLHAPFNTCSH